MLPAPGQAALAIQCRSDDQPTRRLLASLDDARARTTTTAERTFLGHLGGGCAAPIAALGEIVATPAGPTLRLRGRVASVDGARVVSVTGEASVSEGSALAQRLAEEAVRRGARALLG
jgi:hydroxymethylbilane synthase